MFLFLFSDHWPDCLLCLVWEYSGGPGGQHHGPLRQGGSEQSGHWVLRQTVSILTNQQCCGSRNIVFGSGFLNLPQFESEVYNLFFDKHNTLNHTWIKMVNSPSSLLPLFHLFLIVWDPAPYSECGSGSTKLLNTDPIWIRIHNTVNQISLAVHTVPVL